MRELIAILIPIACGCVLPIMIIWMETRRRMDESKNRTQIVMAALEKNPDMDVEELLKKTTPRQKLLKEKLLSKLLWGCITSIIGIGLIAFGLFLTTQEIHMADDVQTSICFGVILLGIGGAFIINYGVGKKMLAKEIEEEQNKQTTTQQ